MAYKCPNCSAKLPDSVNSCTRCTRRFLDWPSFHRETASFEAIYSDVTTRLHQYVAAKATDPSDVAWFDYLIAAFRDQYRSWEWKPHLLPYLLAFHRPRSPRLFALAGDVYLHISYDLPRVIADSLAPYEDPDSFGRSPSEPSNREDGRLLYLGAGTDFKAVLEAHAASFKVAGMFVIFTAIGKRLSALTLLSQWVIALRTVAWVHAETFAGHRRRDELEGALLSAIQTAAQEALKARWNPARWAIPVPTLVMYVAAATFILGAAGDWKIPLAIGSAAVATYAYTIYRMTATAINRLGELMYTRITEAIRSAAEASDTERPRPLPA